jgi:hypothetical protein
MGIKVYETPEFKEYWVDCPACKAPHRFDSRWTFDRNFEAPTFSPSMFLTSTRDGKTYICHSFLRGGIWQFLNDCTHSLAGRNVPAPDWNHPSWNKPLRSGMSDPEATTEVEHTPPPAAPPEAPAAAAEPPDPDAVAKAKATRNAQITAAAGKLFVPLTDKGLTRKQAAVILAHIVIASPDLADFAGFGRTELLAFVDRLPVFNPPAWFAVKDANPEGFRAALAKANVKVGDEEDYVELAALLGA